MQRRICFAPGALLLIAHVPAFAQTQAEPPVQVRDTLVATDAGARRVFVPADFASSAPRTALDMVRQVPGFAIAGAPILCTM